MPNKSKQLHRWRKPRIYLTLAAMLMLGAIALSGLFFTTSMGKSFSLTQDDPSLWFAGAIPLTAFGWLLILALPTSIGAIALITARKVGVFISLAVLPLLAITLGISVFSTLRDPEASLITKALVDLSIAAVMAILGPLLLGWKRIRWKRISAKGSPRAIAVKKSHRV